MDTVALSHTSPQNLPAVAPPGEQAALDNLERYLGAGRALHDWWESEGVNGQFARRFNLGRTFNRPSNAYGFFDEIRTPAGPYPIMGVVQEMAYDHAPGPEDALHNIDSTRRQLREFALKYFMRVSSFQEPAADVMQPDPQATRSRNILNWCRKPGDAVGGFGYSQHFAQRRKDGAIVRFDDAEQYAIVDQRTIGEVYDWVLARVKIYDFAVRFKPFPPPSPELSFSISEDSYVAIAPEFVCDLERPAPGVAAEYGVGYAFVRNPAPGLLAYGPGSFDAAFKTIRFQVLDSGEIRVKMIFISNRPTGVLNVRLDPVAITFRASDLVTFGVTSKLFGGVERALRALPLAFPTLDPVYSYVSVLNWLTGGRAEHDWCISRDQLDLDFLIQHFLVHYRALAGSLVTWRMFPDWLDATRLPKWVVQGIAS
jgi:hypothetical protein